MILSFWAGTRSLCWESGVEVETCGELLEKKSEVLIHFPEKGSSFFWLPHMGAGVEAQGC